MTSPDPGDGRPDTALAWAADGQARFERAVAQRCGDVRGPSRLPGWTRGHVITHVARNAEGLVRLLTWARTGIETPMYLSAEARAADIEAGAGRPLAEQLDDLCGTAAAFAAAASELSPRHWAATVRTRHSSAAASVIPWMRVREVWLHLVDLNVGAELDALPEDIATALVHDVAGWMGSRVAARIELRIPGKAPIAIGPGTGNPGTGNPGTGNPGTGNPGTNIPVSGPAQELAGWLTGRCPGDRLVAPQGLPELPDWL